MGQHTRLIYGLPISSTVIKPERPCPTEFWNWEAFRRAEEAQWHDWQNRLRAECSKWSHAKKDAPEVAQFHGWHVLYTKASDQPHFFAALLTPDLGTGEGAFAEFPPMVVPEDAEPTCREFCSAMKIDFQPPSMDADIRRIPGLTIKLPLAS